MKVSAGILGVTVALLWTLGVGYFNVLIIGNIARQAWTSTWPTTTGRIVYSDAHYGRGETFHSDVRYTYEVEGGTYTSGRLRFSWPQRGTSDFAHEAMFRYPVGATVRVFHDPNDPTIAVLQTGINETDLGHAHAILSFDILVLVMWWFTTGFERITPRRGETVGGARLFTDDGLLRLRLAAISPSIAALFILGLGCLLTMPFVIMENLSLAAILTTWSIVGAITLLVYVWRFRRLRAGAADLVIDHARRTVSLPGMKSRGRFIPFEQIRGVSQRRLGRPTSDDMSPRCGALLVYRDEHGVEQVGEVGCLKTMAQAHEVAEWMRAQLNAPAIDPDELTIDV